MVPQHLPQLLRAAGIEDHLGGGFEQGAGALLAFGGLLLVRLAGVGLTLGGLGGGHEAGALFHLEGGDHRVAGDLHLPLSDLRLPLPVELVYRLGIDGDADVLHVGERAGQLREEVLGVGLEAAVADVLRGLEQAIVHVPSHVSVDAGVREEDVARDVGV